MCTVDNLAGTWPVPDQQYFWSLDSLAAKERNDQKKE
jgi:hypothetical protein